MFNLIQIALILVLFILAVYFGLGTKITFFSLQNHLVRFVGNKHFHKHALTTHPSVLPQELEGTYLPEIIQISDL